MSSKEQLSWLDGVKVLALFGVLFTHLTESFTPKTGFGSYTWLTNPHRNWPSLQERLEHLWPATTDLLPSWIRALGWVGDAGPGVFILLSGFGLCFGLLSAGSNNASRSKWTEFLVRRLSRIYPAYWIAVLVFVSVWPVWTREALSMEGWLGFAMLSGVRATPEVFMFWNPSWWFVWTIAQLYLVFPLLWLLAHRVGFTRMFLVALVITVASRAWGIAYAENLYFWMTGLFAGTRLAEFALGMLLAKLYFSRQVVISEISKLPLLAVSLSLYMCGIVTSIFLVSTIFSNLLTTAGLTGLFVLLWVAVISRLGTRVTSALLWIAPASYAVYLIHQPVLKFIDIAYVDKQFALALGVAWLVASIGISKFLVWLLDQTHRLLTTSTRIRNALNYLLVFASVAGLILLPVLEPYIIDHPFRPAMTWAISAFVVLVFYFELKFASLNWASAIRRCTVLACGLVLWVLPPGSGAVAVLAGVLMYFGWRLIAATVASTMRRMAVIAALIGLAAVPVFLLESHYRDTPGKFDTEGWGELPAMTLHPTRGYGLKPNTTVELDYVYQYTVKTNDAGLQGRAITPREIGVNALRIAVLGDAFTMPEVIEYERSYTAILERALNQCVKDRPVQVFNLGVTGYSPTEKWPQAKELLPTIEPDLVIDQMFPIEVTWMLEDTEDRLKGIGLLADESDDYRSIFTAQQTYQHLLRELADLTEMVSTVPSTYRRSHSLSGMFGSKTFEDPESIRLLAQYWSDVRKLVVDQLGGQFVAAYTPAAIEVSDLTRLNYLPRYFSVSADRSELSRPFNAMHQAAKSARVELLDWRAPLKLAEPNSSGIYSPDFWHWTESGHATAADTLVAMLAAKQLIPASCQKLPPENTVEQSDNSKRASR